MVSGCVGVNEGGASATTCPLVFFAEQKKQTVNDKEIFIPYLLPHFPHVFALTFQFACCRFVVALAIHSLSQNSFILGYSNQNLQVLSNS
jgi:hypothetical protein